MSNKENQNMDAQVPLLMGLRQLRAYLGISDKLARELVNEPGFPAVLIHGRYMIFRDEVKDWLKATYSIAQGQDMPAGGVV